MLGQNLGGDLQVKLFSYYKRKEQIANFMQSESDRLKKQLGQRSGGAIASELAENQDKFFQDEKRLMFLSDIRIPKTGT